MNSSVFILRLKKSISRKLCFSTSVLFCLVVMTKMTYAKINIESSREIAIDAHGLGDDKAQECPSCYGMRAITINNKTSDTIWKASKDDAERDYPLGEKNCEYFLKNEWGSGFTGIIRIRNNTASAINGWSITWQYTDGSVITGSWNASLSGSNPYTANQLNWNATIPAGQFVELGIQGKKGSHVAQIPELSGSVCH